MTYYLLIAAVLTGCIVRADGWGSANPRWQKAIKFFSTYTCAALFALLTLPLHGSLLTACAAFAGFAVWRIPGFDGWEDFKKMFYRGAWTSAIAFALISSAQSAPAWAVLMLAPFSAAYAAIYSGGYKYLPTTVLGFNRHVWIEHASGWAFFLAVAGVCAV